MSKQQYKDKIIHDEKTIKEPREYEIAKVKGTPDNEPYNPFVQHEMKSTLSAEDIQNLIGAHNIEHVDQAKD